MPRGTLAIASLDIDRLPLESGLGLRGRVLCRHSLERVDHNGGIAGLAGDGRGASGSGLAGPRLLARGARGRLVVDDRNGIHTGDRSAFCYYRTAGGADGTDASLREQARREYAAFGGFDRRGGSGDGCHFYSWPGGDAWGPLVSSVRSRLEILVDQGCGRLAAISSIVDSAFP